MSARPGASRSGGLRRRGTGRIRRASSPQPRAGERSLRRERTRLCRTAAIPQRRSRPEPARDRAATGPHRPPRRTRLAPPRRPAGRAGRPRPGNARGSGPRGPSTRGTERVAAPGRAPPPRPSVRPAHRRRRRRSPERRGRPCPCPGRAAATPARHTQSPSRVAGAPVRGRRSPPQDPGSLRGARGVRLLVPYFLGRQSSRLTPRPVCCGADRACGARSPGPLLDEPLFAGLVLGPGEAKHQDQFLVHVHPHRVI
jgi:hypothetical protein